MISVAVSCKIRFKAESSSLPSFGTLLLYTCASPPSPSLPSQCSPSGTSVPPCPGPSLISLVRSPASPPDSSSSPQQQENNPPILPNSQQKLARPKQSHNS